VSDRLTPKAILFDLYGTLLDIKTDEHELRPWEILVSFLRYRGLRITPREMQQEYFRSVDESLNESREDHPDIDVGHVFGTILEKHGVATTPELQRIVAQLFRSLTIKRFRLFPESLPVLEGLAKKRFRLGLVTDSQEPYVVPELQMLGLDRVFEVTVLSAHFGYRKPDARLFEAALEKMQLSREEVVYVGDSTDRDMIGAANAGIAAVWIRRDGRHGAETPPPGVTELPDLTGLLQLFPG
jgi:putative hydrolase of the HAD superfamily